MSDWGGFYFNITVRAWHNSIAEQPGEIGQVDFGKICSKFHIICFEKTSNFVCVESKKNLFMWSPGGRLNKKDGLTRYGDSHVKDKTS